MDRGLFKMFRLTPSQEFGDKVGNHIIPIYKMFFDVLGSDKKLLEKEAFEDAIVVFRNKYRKKLVISYKNVERLVKQKFG